MERSWCCLPSHVGAKGCNKELNPVYMDVFGLLLLGRILGALQGFEHPPPRPQRCSQEPGLGHCCVPGSPPAPLFPPGGVCLVENASKRKGGPKWFNTIFFFTNSIGLHSFHWGQLRVVAFSECQHDCLQGTWGVQHREGETAGLFRFVAGNLFTWGNQCRVSRGEGFWSHFLSAH